MQIGNVSAPMIGAMIVAAESAGRKASAAGDESPPPPPPELSEGTGLPGGSMPDADDGWSDFVREY
jgi:hypothetical protein